MKRGHIRAEDRVVFAHLFGKDDPLIGGGADETRFLFLLPDPDCGEQGADPNPGSAQVADLVDLQTGVNFAGSA